MESGKLVSYRLTLRCRKETEGKGRETAREIRERYAALVREAIERHTMNRPKRPFQ